MSLVTLSSAKVILCLSSSMLARRGWWGHRPVSSHILIKRNHTRTSLVTVMFISSENCLHLHHARSIFLAVSHWDKNVLYSSHGVNPHSFEKELPKLLACKMMSYFLGHPVKLAMFAYYLWSLISQPYWNLACELPSVKGVFLWYLLFGRYLNLLAPKLPVGCFSSDPPPTSVLVWL